MDLKGSVDVRKRRADSLRTKIEFYKNLKFQLENSNDNADRRIKQIRSKNRSNTCVDFEIDDQLRSFDDGKSVESVFLEWHCSSTKLHEKLNLLNCKLDDLFLKMNEKNSMNSFENLNFQTLNAKNLYLKIQRLISNDVDDSASRFKKDEKLIELRRAFYKLSLSKIDLQIQQKFDENIHLKFKELFKKCSSEPSTSEILNSVEDLNKLTLKNRQKLMDLESSCLTKNQSRTMMKFADEFSWLNSATIYDKDVEFRLKQNSTLLIFQDHMQKHLQMQIKNVGVFETFFLQNLHGLKTYDNYVDKIQTTLESNVNCCRQIREIATFKDKKSNAFQPKLPKQLKVSSFQESRRMSLKHSVHQIEDLISIQHEKLNKLDSVHRLRTEFRLATDSVENRLKKLEQNLLNSMDMIKQQSCSHMLSSSS